MGGRRRCQSMSRYWTHTVAIDAAENCANP